MATEELITTSQICETLDIERSTLTRWVARGIAVPAQKLPGPNGAYLFQPAEAERLAQLRGDRKQMPREVPA